MSRRLVPLLLLLPLAAGCGVDDYSDKMVKSQQKLDRWEAELRLLDAPLSIPSRMTKDNKPVSFLGVFIRPPRGISSGPDNFKEPREGMMFRFPVKGGAAPFTLVEATQGDGSATFAAEVMNCYKPDGKPVQRTRPVRGFFGQTTTFLTYEFEDGADFYSVNIAKIGANDQFAVVYKLAKAQKAQALRTIDLSLETFAVGVDALKARTFTDQGALTVPKHEPK